MCRRKGAISIARLNALRNRYPTVKVSNPPATQPQPQSRARRQRDLTGLVLFGLGAAMLIWLAWPQSAPLPSFAEHSLRTLAGVGAYAVPILLMFIGSMFLIGFERLTVSHSTYGSLLLFLTFVTWRHVADPPPAEVGDWSSGAYGTYVMHTGGAIGSVIGTLFSRLLGQVTSYVFLTVSGCMSLVLMLNRPFLEILRSLQKPATAGLAVAKQGVAVVSRKPAKMFDAKPDLDSRALALAGGGASSLPAPSDHSGPSTSVKRKGLFNLTSKGEPCPSTDPLPGAADWGVKGGKRAKQVDEPDEAPFVPVTLPIDPIPHVDTGAPGYTKPPLTLLKEAPVSAQPKRHQQDVADKIKTIETTLEQFGIEANVVEIGHGPTVTRYEVQLAPGIKVSKIVSLADNLAMALAAIDVRVEAPIPGKSAIGIEAPNAVPTMVTLRECISTPEFVNSQKTNKLLFALGKDVAGTFKYADLAKMPHLLVCGSTNSGKSVCLNVIIASLVYRATPREVKLLMIDPKRVELSLWDGIPHLMHPVIKDVRQAAGIFKSALKEMERRYDLFARAGTRNLEGYNEKVSEDEKLPFIVIIVDELADLMMQAAAEVETSICRLAQLARATGIHLVIATQRPSVDVITGLIKANISSRIAFTVSSLVDSRTILDASGAERLIGRGDMLFLPIDANKPLRVQGCYLSEGETNALVKYLKEQEKPVYTFTAAEVSGVREPADAQNDQEDEFWEQAVRLVVTGGHASTSMLQRRFKIGYTRAARLLDVMYDRGIVGPLDGAKPREIRISREQMEQMFSPFNEDE